MAPVISPVTSSGELSATGLSATLRPRRMTIADRNLYKVRRARALRKEFLL